VVSSGCCNEELVELLGGGVEAEGLTGSAVELSGDVVKVALGEGAEVGVSLGKYWRSSLMTAASRATPMPQSATEVTDRVVRPRSESRTKAQVEAVVLSTHWHRGGWSPALREAHTTIG
jgi:hypothetical protein